MVSADILHGLAFQLRDAVAVVYEMFQLCIDALVCRQDIYDRAQGVLAYYIIVLSF